MIDIKFKNVGQGDSILIKWRNNDVISFGIIDCKKHLGLNPILNELQKEEEDFQIEFFIISHGHTDHYSGALELLNYCSLRNIKIKNFISTIHFSQLDLFEILESRNELKLLVELIESANTFYEREGLIEEMYLAYNKIINFNLSNDFTFECIFPRQVDYNKTANNIRKFLRGKGGKPDLNEIATIFKIYNRESLVLFTSDCTIESLNYASRTDYHVNNSNLKLTQVPHHGSVNNHNIRFWNEITTSKNCPAVFSVGMHRTHLLPDDEVVEYFNNSDFDIYSTNIINGIKSVFGDEKREGNFSHLLDNFSFLSLEYSSFSNSKLQGEQRFILNEKGVVTYNRIT